MKDLTETRHDDDFDFALVSGALGGRGGQAEEPAATWHFHDDHTKRRDVAMSEDFSDFFFVARGVIQLGASNGQRPSLEKIAMKAT